MNRNNFHAQELEDPAESASKTSRVPFGEGYDWWP
jgi:hypothetical protein